MFEKVIEKYVFIDWKRKPLGVEVLFIASISISLAWGGAKTKLKVKAKAKAIPTITSSKSHPKQEVGFCKVEVGVYEEGKVKKSNADTLMFLGKDKPINLEVKLINKGKVENLNVQVETQGVDVLEGLDATTPIRKTAITKGNLESWRMVVGSKQGKEDASSCRPYRRFIRVSVRSQGKSDKSICGQSVKYLFCPRIQKK